MEFTKFKFQCYTDDADYIICPYCGAIQEGHEFEQEDSFADFETECQNEDCGKLFLMTPRITFTTVRLNEFKDEYDERPLSPSFGEEAE